MKIKGLWLPLLLCIVFWILVVSIARGDDQFYDYCIIKTTLIKVTDEHGDRIVPDVPCMLYSYVAVSEGADVTYSQDLKNEGKEIMACVAVKHKDRTKIEHLIVGDTFDEVKITQDYTTHFPWTVADMRRTRDPKTQEIIEYEGLDKNDLARFCLWCE